MAVAMVGAPSILRSQTASLVNPNNSTTEHMIPAMQEAARANGVQLHILKASTESEIDAAFASLVQRHAGALVVSSDAFFYSRREQFVALAASHAVPAIYELREFATVGGLISYGASVTAVNRQVGIYAGKILKGANPLSCQSCSRPRSSWSSISRPPRLSASQSRHRSCRAPTRLSSRRFRQIRFGSLGGKAPAELMLL
jgi:hypothetical protein